jgi:gliding motility-associated-like protein
MKKIFLILAAIIGFATTANATHVLGGEISWRCLANGQYIFSMALYRDCTGLQWTFVNETIDIQGVPLPRDASGSVVSSITIRPDVTRLQNSNNGDTSPSCIPYENDPLSCANQDLGTVQAYYYNSSPITLSGTPPGAGWKFFWESPCCRPNGVANVNTYGEMLLRAVMYPGPNGLPADPCFDSSPLFKSLPTTLICRGYEFTFNHTAIDDNLDSMVYSWDRPYNPPQSNPVALTYRNGFSPGNPTPDRNANINNIPATLNSISGVTAMAVYSGVGTEKYITVVRVDAYRESRKIATVFREIPISIFTCPNLPGVGAGQNRVPEVFINGTPTNNTITTIVAGQTASISVQVIDNDRIDRPPFRQILTMVPDGLLFTQSRGKNSPCIVNSTDVEPCAYFEDSNPFVDLTATPPISVLKGLGVIGTVFVWQTDCKHIKTRTGFPGTNEGIYNFVMRVSDDHCPVPGLNYPTITLKVKDPVPLEEPIMKGVSVGLDGTTTFNWVPPVDSARQFNPPVRENDKYEAYSARVPDGQFPNSWLTLDANVRNYQQERNAPNYSPYNFNNVVDPNSGYNILAAFGSNRGQSFDWYVRMRTKSGCTDTNASIWSDPARIIEVDHTLAGVFPDPPRSRACLTWNSPKAPNSNTYSYFRYESPTHYYIHANDSITNGGGANKKNWYIVGDTNATNYCVGATSCNDYVGFRIEARDTVVTLKEGSSDRAGNLDTLYFSTFSTIDTLLMESLSYIPDPTFDTIEVRADGTVFLRINLKGKLTTGTYNIYRNSLTPANLLTTVNALTDSVVVLSGAQTTVQNIVIEAIDACDISNVTNSAVYNTIVPTGNLIDNCRGEYTLNWLQPGGFPNGVAGYRVYANFDDGNGYKLSATINNRNVTTAVISGISRGKTYKFKVVAFDARGAVNISAVDEYIAPNDLKTNALTSPPTPRCTFVNDSGSVKVSWVPAVDTVNNFGYYNIRYKRASDTNWTEIPGNLDSTLVITDDNFTVTGINAQIEKYDFEVTSLSGCLGKTPAAQMPISSIYLSAIPRTGVPDRISDLSWTAAGPDYGANKFFTVNSADSGATLESIGFALTPGVFEHTIQFNGCRMPVNYRVNHIDSLFDPVGFRCEVQSNQPTALHIDIDEPAPENLVMLSFDRFSSRLVAYWIGDAVGADSLRFNSQDGMNTGIPNNVFVGDGAFFPINEGFGPPYTKAIEIADLDARSSVRVVGVQAKGICGGISREFVLFHKSMDVEAEWNICDSTNVVTWTEYVGFNPNFAVEYTVSFSKDDGATWNQIPNSATIDSIFDHSIVDGDINYYYQVTARSLDPDAPAWLQPTSNVDTVFSAYEETPLYNYLTYATVLPSNHVEIEYYRDTITPIKGYTVFRGDNPDEMLPQGYFAADELLGEDRFTFIDETADVNAGELYYQVVSQNDCDIITSQSNFGRTIFLSVQSDDAALTNTLRWNRYLDWDSTVAYYNIYRTTEQIYSTQVYKRLAPNSAFDWNVYVDDISEELISDGKFYYRVEAVQGALLSSAVNGYPSDLTSQVSNSNVAEALQSPLMYVPNAFAPSGINRRFGPKGQFFDFSQFEMSIYNRWGEQIYITKDINKGWDGTVEGEDAAVGSYVYMIRYVDGDGNEKRKKGTVTLIR